MTDAVKFWGPLPGAFESRLRYIGEIPRFFRRPGVVIEDDPGASEVPCTRTTPTGTEQPACQFCWLASDLRYGASEPDRAADDGWRIP